MTRGTPTRAAYTAHVDGELVAPEAATVSVYDRGFLYGDAAFETFRVYGGSVFEWEAHADRLRETCAALHLDHGLSEAVLRDRVDETLKANDLTDALVRLSVTRGVQSGGLNPVDDGDPTVVVLVDALPRGGQAGERTWDEPAQVQTVKTRRTPARAIPAEAKTHSYLNAVLARAELGVTGADEALVLDSDGAVVGGAASNLFFVSEQALCTPALDGPVFPGVTRSVVLDIARSEGIPVREGQFTPDDVRGAAEVFVTSTRWELRPVATVDGIECGGGPVTTLLSRLFDRQVETYYADETDQGDKTDTAEAVDSRWDVDAGS